MSRVVMPVSGCVRNAIAIMLPAFMYCLDRLK